MLIRNYQPGDEHAQAEIFNTVAGKLPKFKPATAEEIGRRYATSDHDPTSKFYAIVDGRVVGYAVLNPNGRISYPWCLPGGADAQSPLLEAVLKGLGDRGCSQAWATYRADWSTVIEFFKSHGFTQSREFINYVTEVARLPKTTLTPSLKLAPLDRSDAPAVWRLGQGLFEADPERLESFYFRNTYFEPDCVYTLKQSSVDSPIGVAVAITNPKYADPTKVDAAMPCFRLGAIGTESDRHKRINGMFSCVFRTDGAGELLLAEAALRFTRARLTHAAAQAPSDRLELVQFYDRYFQRQGAFPILSRRLGESH